MIFTGLGFKKTRRFRGGRPFVFGDVDLQEFAKRMEMLRRDARELPVRCFSAIEEPGAEEVARKLLQGERTLFVRKIRAIVEMTVKPHRALEFAAASEEVPEHALEFRQFRVHADDFNKGVNGFVGSSVQKKGETPRTDFRHLRRFAALLLIPAAAPPAGKEENRNKDQIPVVEFHRAVLPRNNQRTALDIAARSQREKFYCDPEFPNFLRIVLLFLKFIFQTPVRKTAHFHHFGNAPLAFF